MAERDLNKLAERFLQDLAARTQASTQPMAQRAMTIPNQRMPTPRAQDLFNQMMARRQQAPALPPSADPAAAMQMMQDQSRAAMLAQAANDPSNPVQNVTAPVPPQYINRPDLHVRGNPDDPAQQTRQYAAPLPQAQPPAVQPGPGVTGGTFTPQQALDMFLNSPAAQTMDPASFASAYANLYHELTTTQPKATPPPPQDIGSSTRYGHADDPVMPIYLPTSTNLPVGTTTTPTAPDSNGVPIPSPSAGAPLLAMPPPTWGGSKEEWDRLPEANKQGLWDVFNAFKAATTPSLTEAVTDRVTNNPITRTLDTVRDVTTVPLIQNISEHTPQVVKDILNYDPTTQDVRGHSVKEATDTAVKVAGWLETQTQENVADGAYYMMTHDGQLPSDWGGTEGYGTFVTQLLADNALVPGKLSSVSYLHDHPELWPEATKIYQEAEAKQKGSGAAALIAWYEVQVGPWWATASHLALDPLNWALGLKVPAELLKAAEVNRSIQASEKGVEASRLSKVLGAAGKTLEVASDPLNKPVEKLWEGLGWAARKVPGAQYGRAATEAEAREAAANAEAVIKPGEGSDEAFQRMKNETDTATQAAIQRRTASTERRDAQMKGKRTAGNQPTPPPPGSTIDSVAQRQAEYDSWAAKAEERIAKNRGGPATDPMSTTELMAERDALEAVAIPTEAQVNRLKKVRKTLATRTDTEQVAAELATPNPTTFAAPPTRTPADILQQDDAARQAEEARIRTEDANARAEAARQQRTTASQTQPFAPPPTETPGSILSREQAARDAADAADAEAARVAEISRSNAESGAAGRARMEAARTAEETPTEPPRPAVYPSERIEADVTANGQTVRKDYYDPRSGKSEVPDLVAHTYGPANPEAAQRFWDEFVPRAREQMVNDARYEEGAAQRIKKGGNVVDRLGKETPDRVLDRVTFDAWTDDLFSRTVGNGARPFRERELLFDMVDRKTGVRRMHPSDPRSWIEHALFGTNDADHAAAIAKIRARDPRITNQFDNKTLANRLDEMWRRLGETPVGPEAATQAPLREPGTPLSFDELPDRVKQDMELFRDRILSADETVSRQAAKDAHRYRLPSDVTPEEKAAWNKEVDRLRDESPHPTSRSKRSPGSTGIVHDPRDAAAQLDQTIREGLGQVSRKIIRDPLNPAQEVFHADSVMVKGKAVENVRNPSELLDHVNSGDWTQREMEVVLEPRQITRKLPNGDTKVEQTNLWNEYQNNLDKYAADYRTQYAKSGLPTDEEGLAAFKEKMTTAHEKAWNEAQKALTPKGVKVGRAKRIAGGTFNMNRNVLQFNIITGPKAIFKDIVGNLHLTILTGNAGAARYVPGIMWDLVKDELGQLDILKTDAFTKVRESGIEALPADLSHTIGKEEVERRITKADRRGALHPANAGDSYWIRRIRGGNDNAYRHSIYVNRFNKGVAREQAKFLDFVRQKEAAGKVPQDMWDEVSRLVRERFNDGRSFSPEEIRTITRKYTTDDSFARTWAKQVDDLSVAANKAQKTVMFTYKKTKIDDQISKVFLFHYYMTRSSALYVKLMLQHPQLISLEHMIWENSQRSLEKYPGTPDWMKGFVAFGLGDGHVLYSNPFQFISRIAVFQSLGDGGYSKSRLEEGLNQTGLFLNPMWKSALAIAGYANTTNPFGTTQLERMVQNTIDQVRFSDFGRAHGWDKWRGGQITPAAVQDIVDGISDAINEQFREWGAPIRDFEATDSDTKHRQAIMDIITTNAQEEDWDDARLAAAQNALLMGESNPDVDAAIEEYTNLNMASSVGNAVIPSDAYVQDAATNQRKEEARQAKEVPYDQRTPEQATQVAAQDIASIQSAEGQTLQRGMNDYNAAGTLSEQQIQDGINQITLGYAEIPSWWQATIGGKTYRGSDIKNMTDAERQDLAYQWAAEQQNAAGIAVGAKVSGPDYLRDNPNASLAGKREQVRAEHPEIDDYLKFRSWSYKDEVDVPTTITQMLAVGDTEFSRAYHRHEDYLRSQGVEGPELQAEMEQWFRSPESYAAMQGWQWKDRADPGAPLFNINNLPPWQEDVGQQADTAQKKANQAADSAQLRGPVEDVGSFVRDRARQYNQDQFPWRQKKKTGASSGTGSPLSYLLKDYIG